MKIGSSAEGTASAGAAAFAAAGAAALGASTGAVSDAAVAFPAPEDKASSISRFTMRPWGPDPDSFARSSPSFSAMRRARGEANIRSPEDAAGFSVGFSAAGSGFDAGFSAAFSIFAGSDPFAAAASDLESPTDAIAVSMSSPSSARIAMGSLTATPSVPPSIRILAIMPSSTASNSIVALSVSISAITSPDATLSPSFKSHFANVPSVMVGDSAGIRILIAIVVSPSCP